MLKGLRSLLILFSAAFALNSGGQQVTWYWTTQGDSAESYAEYDAVDRNSNCYYTGYFNTGPRQTFGNIAISLSGTQSDFIVKYDPNGNPLWARDATALANTASTTGISVATDRNNSVFETGYYTDSIAFGAFHLNTGNASTSTYLVKYDANGNTQWAKTPVSSDYNEAYYVATDKSNNVLVTGVFEDSIYFNTYKFYSANEADMFLVKYNASGKVSWAAAAITNASFIYGTCVATDDSCNVYVSGSFQDSIYFTPYIKIGNNSGMYNAFLAKYDSNGNCKWAIDIPVTYPEVYPTADATDKSGNVYVTSQFTNAALTLGPSTITDNWNSCSNAMLLKCDRNGNMLWATCAANISMAEVCVIVESSVATDKCNNVYWSGVCSDTFAIGNVYITVPGGGSHPSRAFTYIIKLDSAGNAIGGAGISTQNPITLYFSNGLAIDSLSHVYLDECFPQPASIVVGNDTVYRYLSYSTSFISKLAIGFEIQNSKKDDSICVGDSVVLKVTPAPGTVYKWSTGATTDSIIVKPVITTNYSVVVNNNCNMDTSYVTVFVNSLNLSITGKDSICEGESVELVGSGGNNYQWSNNQTTDSISVKPDSTQTYTLTSVQGTCTYSTPFTVKVTPGVKANLSVLHDTICAKGVSVITANAIHGLSYKWSNGITTSSVNVTDSVNTSYSVTIYGLCDSVNLTTSIKVNPAITFTMSATPDSVCPNGTSVITANPNGGGVTFKWSNGATTSSITVSDSVTTTYSATVYGICDSAKNNITITVVPLPTPLITGTRLKCHGVKDTLAVSGGSTYIWSNGSTTTSYITGAIKADSIISVTVENNFGCAVKDTFNITLKNPPQITNISPASGECGGHPATIGVTAKGNGPFTYTWSPGGATSDSITVSPDSATTYTVSISNGCKVSETVLVSPDYPAINACCNNTILLGDDTILSASGNAIKYRWLDSNEIICLDPPACDSVKVAPTVTTTYTVIGTDKEGCESERIITITVEIPCFNFIVPNVFTPNGDGINDFFEILVENTTQYSIIIFDRWGTEVFKTSNPMLYWDGKTESGANAPDGVYYYILSAFCNGKTVKKNGFVEIIR